MIRDLIKKQLAELGKSNRAFALEMNINYSTFHNFVSGQRPLPYDDLERVLIALDLLKQP